MARAQTAFLNRKNIPERPALQAAVDALGFKLTLDESYAPFETAGYLPCTLDGEDAGFDIRFQDVAVDLSPALKAAIADSDAAIGFRWSGDPREQLAAPGVCAALAAQFGAVVHEPDTDALLSFDQLMAKVRQTEASL
jgi:hypothetical protein